MKAALHGLVLGQTALRGLVLGQTALRGLVLGQTALRGLVLGLSALAAGPLMAQPAAPATAIFAGGCFWCVESDFDKVPGVLSTVSGYTGGTVAKPTYEQVSSKQTGHAEAVRIEFDPAVIGFADLLDIFFAIHDPTTPNRQGNDVGTQYRSAIFATTPEQEALARQKVAELNEEAHFGAPIVTEILAAPRFWPAEPYHHDYFSRNGHQPYCQYVVAPKVAKFRSKFAKRVKAT